MAKKKPPKKKKIDPQSAEGIRAEYEKAKRTYPEDVPEIRKKATEARDTLLYGAKEAMAKTPFVKKLIKSKWNKAKNVVNNKIFK